MELLKFHGIPWNFSTGYSYSMEFHGIWLCSQIPLNFLNSMEFHGTFVLGLAIPWNSIEFHGIWCWHQVPWNFQSSMEFHGTSLSTWKNSMEFHGIPWNFWRVPWNSMELWNIDTNKFHNWGSVFRCLLHDFMFLYVRQSISSWINEIFQFQSNFLVPLILLKWRYSILNGGLLYI